MRNVASFFFFTFFLLTLLEFTPAGHACTIFTVSVGDQVMFGGNEDQTPNSSFLIVDKTGAIGVVYFATPWKQYPMVMQMGINEMGLCYDTNWIPPEKLKPHLERKPQYEWAITQLMKEASTVNEVLSKIFNYNWGSTISYQVHFADRSGDAVVVHPGKNGELTFTRKSKGKDYLISTNFNLLKLEGGDWSCQRYKTADTMLLEINKKSNLTVQSMASVLNATCQNGLYKTIYSAVYDLKKLRIYLFYNRNFDTPYELFVRKELEKTKSYRSVSLKELVGSMNNSKSKQ